MRFERRFRFLRLCGRFCHLGLESLLLANSSPPCVCENLNAKKATDSAIAYFFFGKNCHFLSFVN